jgi:acetyltransferase
VISLLADLGEGLDLRFPGWTDAGRARVQQFLPPYAGVENPLDAWGFGKVEEAYLPCLKAAAEQPEADLILVSQDVPAGMAPRQVEQYAAVAEAAAAVYDSSGKPVVFLSNPSGGFDAKIRGILDRAGVPLLQGSREGLRAIDHAIAYGRFLTGDPIPAVGAAVSPAAEEVRSLFAGRRGAMTEVESKQVLAAYGVTRTPERLCGSADEAVAAAREIGGPVALKVMSPQILHKTEAGIIALDLSSEDEIRGSYERLVTAARSYDSRAQIDGVLCQKMAAGAVAEAIAGLLIDPQFGPAVIFGMGGIMVEVLGDRALGIPPLDRDTAGDMIDQTRTSRILKGFRGAPPADLEALIDVLIAVGNLAVDWSERIEALDINPLLIMPEGQGTVAVDALLVLK